MEWLGLALRIDVFINPQGKIKVRSLDVWLCAGRTGPAKPHPSAQKFGASWN
jgi:hypothetical protein